MVKSGIALAAALAVTGALAGLQPAVAQQTPIKFTLDFVLQGPQAPFFLAQEKGYYAADGLNVTAIDAGRGSSDTVNRVVSGAYDIGFGDLNALIEFNAKNPGKEVPAVLMVYDQAPFAIITLKNKGIAKPADLAGKKAAAPSFDTPFRLFSLFAKANGFDAGAVNWANVAPPLREPMLAKGEADAISGFSFTAVLALKGLGVPESNVQAFMYKDYGVDLYSNAVIASAKLIQENPKAVQGFVKATIKGIQDTIADPKAAIAALKKKDPLINDAIELERLQLALSTSVLTADVKANGIGGVTADRLNKNIELVTSGFNLDRKVTAEQVFVDRFLPPKAERMPAR
jgi:NitT/TauT family transport system substrate-binding protein